MGDLASDLMGSGDKCSCPWLLGRILKHLAAMDIIRELDADLFGPTDILVGYIRPELKCGIDSL